MYVDTECGKLTWGEIHRGKASGRATGTVYQGTEERKQMVHAGEERVDSFSERFGGRHPLLHTVMELLGAPALKGPIIIQGVAGSGKSSFTLRLCDELRKNHLRPLWIRLKDLDLTRNIEDYLPAAVRLSEKEMYGNRSGDADLFAGGELFKEAALNPPYDKISRYVLILDGWDEVSVAGEGFQRRIDKMLEQLNNTYVRARTRRYA